MSDDDDEPQLKLSELIAHLQTILAERGDLPVQHSDDCREFPLTVSQVCVWPAHMGEPEFLMIGEGL